MQRKTCEAICWSFELEFPELKSASNLLIVKMSLSFVGWSLHSILTRHPVHFRPLLSDPFGHIDRNNRDYKDRTSWTSLTRSVDIPA